MRQRIVKKPERIPTREEVMKLSVAELARLDDMQRRINALIRKLNTNSTRSDIPPSRAPIGFDRSADKDKDGVNDKAEPPATGKPRRRGGQKGHRGRRIRFSTPETVADLHPMPCTCGCMEFADERHFQPHQQLEVPSHRGGSESSPAF